MAKHLAKPKYLTDDIVKQLLSPLGADVFFDKYWLKTPIQIASEYNFSYLLSSSDIETLLYFGNANIRILKYVDGEVINWQLARNKNTPDMYSVYDAWNEGNSLSIDDLHLYWPVITEFCQRLETILHGNVGANIYFTPPASQCFPPHYDGHDVIVLQLEGKKKWKVWSGDEISPPTDGAPIKDLETLGPTILEPVLNEGDVLYIPRGFPHQAVSGDERSLHITFQVVTPTVALFRKTVIQSAKHLNIPLPKNMPSDFYDADKDPSLTSSLPVGFLDREKIDPGLSRWFNKKDLKKLVDTAKQAFIHGLTYDRQPSTDGYFAKENSIDEVEANTPLIRRSFSLCTWGEAGSESWFKFHRHTIKGEKKLLDVFKYIAETTTFCVNDLPGNASLESKFAVISELLKKGFIKISG